MDQSMIISLLLMNVKQPSKEDFHYVLKNRAIPFTLRAQIINSYVRNARECYGHN